MLETYKERASTGDRNLDLLLEGGFPRGSLIILAGNPGTGKTAFGASFICKGAREFNETGVYVSLSEDKETFYRNVSRHFKIDCEDCGRKDSCIFLDYIAVKEEGVSAMLESILGEVLRNNAKRLVIDSFTAMAQALKEPFEQRIILHTILGRIVRKMGCTTLLICEVPMGTNMIGRGMEEFIADGVIILRASSIGGRLFRDLEVRKMRGTFIKENRVSFTLYDGFRTIPPFTLRFIDKPIRCKPIPHPPGRFATISQDLNDLLGGGFRRGLISLLEVGEGVSLEEFHFSVLLPLKWNFLSNGQPILGILSPGVDHRVLLSYMAQGGFTDEEMGYTTKFIKVGYSEEVSGLSNVIAVEGRDVEADLKTITEEALKMMREHHKSLLLVLSTAIAAIYGLAGLLKILSILSTVIREHNSLLFLILKPGFEKLGRIVGGMADTHIKVIKEHGTILLYGIKPRTRLYAVEIDVSQGYPLPKLTPIV